VRVDRSELASVRTRKKKPSKPQYGTSHFPSKAEAKAVFEK
jgi:hypothetical protein